MKGFCSFLLVSLSVCFAWAQENDCPTHQPKASPTEIRIKTDIPLNPDPEINTSYYLYQTVGQSTCQTAPIGACTITANEFGSAVVPAGIYSLSDMELLNPDTINKAYRLKIVVETESSPILKQLGEVNNTKSELSFFCAIEKLENITPSNVNLLLYEMAELQ